jgi:hypothetical protein
LTGFGTIVTYFYPIYFAILLVHRSVREFITSQNEREESTQNTTVTKSAACASYKIKTTT